MPKVLHDQNTLEDARRWVRQLRESDVSSIIAAIDEERDTRGNPVPVILIRFACETGVPKSITIPIVEGLLLDGKRPGI